MKPRGNSQVGEIEQSTRSNANRATPDETSFQGPRTGQRRKEPRFELIPYKMVGINARAVLPREAWIQICKMAHAYYGGKCCECRNDLPARLECHEVWKYDWVLPPGHPKKVGIMRLTGLRSLCHLCHRGKHFDFAEGYGELPQVKAHLMRLYGLSEPHLEQLMREAYEKVEILTHWYEKLDLTYLNNKRFNSLRAQIGHHSSDRLSSSVPLDKLNLPQLLRRLRWQSRNTSSMSAPAATPPTNAPLWRFPHGTPN